MEEAAAKLALRREVIGQRIREARLAKGWKQKQLANAVNVEPQTVSNWERGVSTPDLDMLELIAKKLGVEVTHLLRDPVLAAKEQATIERVLEIAGELLGEVRVLRAGQAEIDSRLARLEEAGLAQAGSVATR